MKEQWGSVAKLGTQNKQNNRSRKGRRGQEGRARATHTHSLTHTLMHSHSHWRGGEASEEGSREAKTNAWRTQMNGLLHDKMTTLFAGGQRRPSSRCVQSFAFVRFLWPPPSPGLLPCALWLARSFAAQRAFRIARCALFISVQGEIGLKFLGRNCEQTRMDWGFCAGQKFHMCVYASSRESGAQNHSSSRNLMLLSPPASPGDTIKEHGIYYIARPHPHDYLHPPPISARR